MSDIYQEVTHKIVEALKQKVAPWIKPWHPGRPVSSPFFSNAVTGRAYRGVNIMLLWAEARLQGYSQDRWLTYLQAKEAGGHIRKGERSTLTVFYSHKEREARDQSGNITEYHRLSPQLVTRKVPIGHSLLKLRNANRRDFFIACASHRTPGHHATNP